MATRKVSKEKKNGVVYTPHEMADFVSGVIIEKTQGGFLNKKMLKIMDPAIGQGELIDALVTKLRTKGCTSKICLYGYEIDSEVANKTEARLKKKFSDCEVKIEVGDFIESSENSYNKCDIIIANPPYIRTQILGTERARELAMKFNICGKVDIYYAFIIKIHKFLNDKGIAGIITSNKILSIKSGKTARDFILDNYYLHEIIDFGDTKLFTASVLPCFLVLSLGCTNDVKNVKFTSIYETKKESTEVVRSSSVFESMKSEGIVKLANNRLYLIEHGNLCSAARENAWCLESKDKKEWLRAVEVNTLKTFADIGKIHVGIKTTADSVFISNCWEGELELLRPLITHRNAGQIFSDSDAGYKVLYPHQSIRGKTCAVNLDLYPISKAYLLKNYSKLSSRKYIIDSKRKWYEIWVPQNPNSWFHRKIVFRDISEKPQFWYDESPSIVNGDCYWIEIGDEVADDDVYLALAVANTRFIETYYDIKFNTKLYSGKRRFMSQYVGQFPLPPTFSCEAREAISIVKTLIREHSKELRSRFMGRLEELVSKMFGLS